MAVSVYGQSLADVARKERERQANTKPVGVFKAEGAPAPAPKTEEAKPDDAAKPEEGKADAAATKPEEKTAEKPAEAPKEAAKPAGPAVDPTKEWNEQLQTLRTKIQDLQDQETATQLQINDLNNQIYAPVVDPAAKDEAMARVAEVQQKLSAIRVEEDQTRKTLESLQLQGPPKK